MFVLWCPGLLWASAGVRSHPAHHPPAVQQCHLESPSALQRLQLQEGHGDHRLPQDQALPDSESTGAAAGRLTALQGRFVGGRFMNLRAGESGGAVQATGNPVRDLLCPWHFQAHPDGDSLLTGDDAGLAQHPPQDGQGRVVLPSEVEAGDALQASIGAARSSAWERSRCSSLRVKPHRELQTLRRRCVWSKPLGQGEGRKHGGHRLPQPTARLVPCACKP